MYTLYQNERGLWGARDENGRNVFPACYLRKITDDGREIFHSEDGFEVCTFDAENGFFPQAWCSGPWWDEGMLYYNYSPVYADYVMKYCLGDHDRAMLTKMLQAIKVFDAVPGLALYLADMREAARIEIEHDIYSDFENRHISNQERYDAIEPYLEDKTYPAFAREALAYLTFLTILNDL